MDKNNQNVLADIEGLDILKDELYESKMMTNDDTRAITDKFCGNCGKSEYAHLQGVGATHCDSFTEVGLESTTCPTCDQYPYSKADKHCPVCFVEIESEVE